MILVVDRSLVAIRFGKVVLMAGSNNIADADWKEIKGNSELQYWMNKGYIVAETKEATVISKPTEQPKEESVEQPKDNKDSKKKGK